MTREAVSSEEVFHRTKFSAFERSVIKRPTDSTTGTTSGRTNTTSGETSTTNGQTSTTSGKTSTTSKNKYCEWINEY